MVFIVYWSCRLYTRVCCQVIIGCKVPLKKFSLYWSFWFCFQFSEAAITFKISENSGFMISTKFCQNSYKMLVILQYSQKEKIYFLDLSLRGTQCQWNGLTYDNTSSSDNFAQRMPFFQYIQFGSIKNRCIYNIQATNMFILQKLLTVFRNRK